MKKILILTTVLVAAMMVMAAKPNTDSFTLPEKAREVAPGVYDLGETVHKGKSVQGFAFVRYKKGFHHRPDHSKGGPNGGDSGSSCYEFMGKDVKWNSVEPWVMNPANANGLDEATLFLKTESSIAKWEDAADGSVDGTIGADILGEGTRTDSDLVADTNEPDDTNEVYFGSISDQGAIAVTIVWGVFRGPPSQRGITEWDQIYDQADYDWSLTGEAEKMDYENIATHELGHAIGLGHPADDCTEETMHAYADYGEKKKRTLHTGDIAGTDDLYP